MLTLCSLFVILTFSLCLLQTSLGMFPSKLGSSIQTVKERESQCQGRSLTATAGIAMGLDKFQVRGGRNPPPDHTKQSFPVFNPTKSHGHMASSSRSRKNLVCFYCNKKSAIRYDGIITKWDCAQCESTNFLDEKGGITDPPVATEYAAPRNLKYAIPRPDSPPSSRGSTLDLFCSTCLKNQHLFTASLAQYDVELDPYHPQFRERERQYYKYRNNLEKRYPQVCEDCEPKVLERMREAGKTAKTDYLRRLMDKSREKRFQKPRRLTISSAFEFSGKALWYAGFFGQLLWSFMTLAAYTVHNSPTLLEFFASPVIILLDSIIVISTSRRWARTSLYFSIVSVWWNPMFSQANRGFMSHISGFADWYKFQVLMVVTRSIFYIITGTGVRTDPLSQQNVGAHIFIFIFIILLAIKARRSVRVDMTPLWSAPPQKFANVGSRLRSSSPSTAIDSMADILDSISTAAATRDLDLFRPSPPLQSTYQQPPSSPLQSSYAISRGPQQSFTPSPPLQSSHQGQLSHQHNTTLQIHKRRDPLALPRRTSPSLAGMTLSESTQYIATRKIPVRVNQSNGFEPMDWTPAKLQSEYRAFKPARSLERNTQLFGQAPVGDQKSPFWYKVPPAPITPAQRIRNPPNQPRLRVSSQEVKENFFKTVTRRGSDSDQDGNFVGQRNEKSRHDIEFAQQRFFPPAPPSETGNNLADLLTTFSLGSSDPEAPKTVEKKSRLQHGCQALVLFLGISFWNHAFSNPSEHSKSIMLTVMIACILIGARTTLDNTIFSPLEKQQGFSQGVGAILGGLECAMGLYRIVEIVAGRGDCVDCASLGMTLLGGMLVQELWYSSFGY